MTIKILMPELIHKSQLAEHPRNSNKQDRHTFKELRKSIRDNGFDESLTVVPRNDEDGYFIVAGNHRFRAGVAEGMEEFPCVVHSDWDAVKEQIELVRRNYVRGDIDSDSFTNAVDMLSQDHLIPVDDIRNMMGFEDSEEFLKLYKEDTEQYEAMLAETEKTTAPQVKMVDDLGLILSAIFERYGHTVPNSFIIFPSGGKNHVFIAANPSLVKSINSIASHCLAKHLDINIALAGLLALGINEASWMDLEPKLDLIREAADEDGSDEFELEEN